MRFFTPWWNVLYSTLLQIPLMSTIKKKKNERQNHVELQTRLHLYVQWSTMTRCIFSLKPLSAEYFGLGSFYAPLSTRLDVLLPALELFKLSSLPCDLRDSFSKASTVKSRATLKTVGQGWQCIVSVWGREGGWGWGGAVGTGLSPTQVINKLINSSANQNHGRGESWGGELSHCN